MKTDRIWRALSIALALCLTLALAPTCAFATDADAEPAESPWVLGSPWLGLPQTRTRSLLRTA